MTAMALGFGWYLLGMAGCLLMWFEQTCQKWRGEPQKFLCPSPKVITLCLFGAIFGPALLFAGLIIVATSSDIGKDSWWNTPVCK